MEDKRKNNFYEKKELIYQNRKMLICKNIINDEKKCKYGDKCAFAHSLKEQKLLPIRKRAYDIISGNNDLTNIDLSKDRELYSTLVQLSKVCFDCDAGKCTGGYNCRNGAIDSLHQVCFDDLTSGNCRKEKCNLIHLTKRGLKPFIKMQQTNLIKKIEINEFALEISDDEDLEVEKSIFEGI